MKKLFFVVFFTLTCFISNGWADISGDPGIKRDAPEVSVATIAAATNIRFISEFASPNAAVAAIGSTVTTLVLSAPSTATGDLVFPSTLSVVPLKGGIISHAAYNITMPCPQAGLYQIFSGTGTVSLLGCSKYPVEWQGAVPLSVSNSSGTRAANTTAINKAVADAWASNSWNTYDGTKTAVKFSTIYGTSGEILVEGVGHVWEGSGALSSGITNYSVTQPAVRFHHDGTKTGGSNSGWVEMSDMGIRGDGGGVTASVYGIKIDGTFGEVRLRNIDLAHNRNHGIYGVGGGTVIKGDGIHAYGNAGDGVNLVSNTAGFPAGNATSVTNSLFFSNAGYGMQWLASGLNLVGNTFEGNALGSVRIGVPFGGTPAGIPAGINITGNYFETTTLQTVILAHIEIYVPTGYFLDGCKIDGNFFTGGQAEATNWKAMVYVYGGGRISNFDYGVNTHQYVSFHKILDASNMLDNTCKVWSAQAPVYLTNAIVSFVNLGTAKVDGGMTTDFTSRVVTYGTLTGAFFVGETVTDTTSGATGVIFYDVTSILGLNTVSGTFGSGHTITGLGGGSATILVVQSNIDDLYHFYPTTKAVREYVAPLIKTDTGDPSTGLYEGRIVINTYDNNVKIFADGALRQIATW